MKKTLDLFRNKWREYLIEMIVIILGILLAIALNNWNDTRKNRKEEAFYLEKLKENLSEDIGLIEGVIQTNLRIIEATDSLLAMLSNPGQYDRSRFGREIRVIRNFRRFFPMKTTFDNLVSSGRMDLVSNQQLTEQLFSYYRFVAEYAQSNSQALADITRTVFTPYFLGFDYWDKYEPIQNSTLMKKYMRPFDLKKKPIKAFAEDPFIINALYMKIGMLERHNQVYEEISIEAKKLVRLLEEDLKP